MGSASRTDFLSGLIEFLAHLVIAAEGDGPIDDADPVVGLGIVGLDGNVALVVGLGILELFRVEGIAADAVEDASRCRRWP